MFSTFEAAIVAFVALIPGAAYVWAVERWVGRWGAGLSDSLLRFAGVSAVFHIALAPLTFWIWKDLAGSPPLLQRTFPPLLWVAVGSYLVLPFVAGAFVGIGMRHRWKFVTNLAALRAPKAWDHLFTGRRNGWVKLRLKSGAWIGGWFGRFGQDRSYAAGHPQPSDIYLVRSVEVDQATGAFLVRNDGRPHEFLPGILVRWDEIEYLKFIEEAS